MVIATICCSQPTAKSVDLGLPSGTLWADRNVGASSPEDYGDYFAWGETTTKSNYEWSTYKYANGSKFKLTKYCSTSDYGNNGYTDSHTILERSDDAATVNWGRDWCMPTQHQFQELYDNCTWIWTTRNGKNGYEIKGKNGKSIFIPAAGSCIETTIYGFGSWGNYWSSSLNTDDSFRGYMLDFDEEDSLFPDEWVDRCYGQSVRPVREMN